MCSLRGLNSNESRPPASSESTASLAASVSSYGSTSSFKSLSGIELSAATAADDVVLRSTTDGKSEVVADGPSRRSNYDGELMSLSLLHFSPETAINGDDCGGGGGGGGTLQYKKSAAAANSNKRPLSDGMGVGSCDLGKAANSGTMSEYSVPRKSSFSDRRDLGKLI